MMLKSMGCFTIILNTKKYGLLYNIERYKDIENGLLYNNTNK